MKERGIYQLSTVNSLVASHIHLNQKLCVIWSNPTLQDYVSAVLSNWQHLQVGYHLSNCLEPFLTFPYSSKLQEQVTATPDSELRQALCSYSASPSLGPQSSCWKGPWHHHYTGEGKMAESLWDVRPKETWHPRQKHLSCWNSCSCFQGRWTVSKMATPGEDAEPKEIQEAPIPHCGSSWSTSQKWGQVKEVRHLATKGSLSGRTGFPSLLPNTPYL